MSWGAYVTLRVCTLVRSHETSCPSVRVGGHDGGYISVLPQSRGGPGLLCSSGPAGSELGVICGWDFVPMLGMETRASVRHKSEFKSVGTTGSHKKTCTFFK